ncbi:MAG: hypothetical protein KAJ29_02385, partial [Alphaproteobacteria bacterium]|nr:hypothetical protein [Alphaproteobacteria bacterium]
MIRILTLFSTLTSLLFVLLAIGGTAHVYAQEMLETIPIDQTTQPNVDYAKTESLGLLGAKDKGSFGNGLLQHTKRSELVALLKIVEQSKWVSMRPLVKNFLLTETDATALTGDVPITPGEDLLTLRLNALLR